MQDMFSEEWVTWVELPQIVEVQVLTSIVAPEYVQLSIVGNLK